MKYALYQNKRVTPQKDIKDAVCPVCGELVIPKCGKIKMHHWAHKTFQNCDPWWENETEWHRKWKDNFSEDFQEYLMIDSLSGEKHIADIRTDEGFIIEFQHSSIKPEEREAREAFYKNMVWVVDASKYYENLKQALQNKSLKHRKTNKNYFYIEENYFDNKINFLPKLWLESSVPILFDFGINSMTDSNFDKQKGWLWCILPEKYVPKSYVFGTTYCGIYLRKTTFLNKILKDNQFFPNVVLQELKEIEQKRILEKEKAVEEYYKEKKEYEKNLKKQNQIKYANDKIWCDAIMDLKIALENNNLKFIKLFVTDDGKITDYQKNIYNNFNAMALSMKSYEDYYQGKPYTKNEILLLINLGDRFVTGVITMPSALLDLTIWSGYNFFIHKLDIIPWYTTYKIFFTDSERIYTDQLTRNNLEFILNKFAENILK